MRKEIVCAIALGASIWGAAASAQDAPTPAAAPPAATDAPAPSGDDVIHLHMPAHHRPSHRVTQPGGNAVPAESPTVDAIGADTAAPPAAVNVPPAAETQPPPATISVAKPAKSAAPVHKAAPAIPFTFGEDSGNAPPAPEAANRPANAGRDASAVNHETKTVSLPPKPQIPTGTPAPAKPVREANRAKDDAHTGLVKRGAVLFDKGVSNPSPSQFEGVKLLAGEVSSALESGAQRVQLEAYAGGAGDKSSDARRLSLRRALAVRQLLIDSGIPSNRIDVRAMGGADDRGPDDRVDVFLRAS